MAQFFVQDQQGTARASLDNGQVGTVNLDCFLTPLLLFVRHLHLPQ
jgi:hypothetical protein